MIYFVDDLNYLLKFIDKTYKKAETVYQGLGDTKENESNLLIINMFELHSLVTDLRTHYCNNIDLKHYLIDDYILTLESFYTDLKRSFASFNDAWPKTERTYRKLKRTYRNLKIIK